jgi:hypothetical protein
MKKKIIDQGGVELATGQHTINFTTDYRILRVLTEVESYDNQHCGGTETDTAYGVRILQGYRIVASIRSESATVWVALEIEEH